MSTKAWREANKEKLAEYNKAWYEANKQVILVKSRAYREANKKRIKENMKVWREANFNRIREARKRYDKKYFSTERGKTIKRINSARHRASKLQRTPRWLAEVDFKKIERKYAYAQRKTETTGEQWVVDHVIPLRGKFVSGLHVPTNLRVIKRVTNCSKQNHFDLEKEWRLTA